jgi:hypothetical protein
MHGEFVHNRNLPYDTRCLALAVNVLKDGGCIDLLLLVTGRIDTQTRAKPLAEIHRGTIEDRLRRIRVGVVE